MPITDQITRDQKHPKNQPLTMRAKSYRLT